MGWDDNGANNERYVIDQQGGVAAWGASQVAIPFNRIQNAGYLRAARLKLPPTVFPITPGTGTAAVQPSAQLGPLRALARLQISTQVVANLVDVKGQDIYFLRYARIGNLRTPTFEPYYPLTGSTPPVNGGTPVQAYSTGQTIATGVSTTISLDLMLPLTERIKVRRRATQQSADGKTQAIVSMDQEMEVGLISLQNSQFAMQPRITLNPFYSGTVDSALLTTGNATAGGPATFQIATEIYDVPQADADKPSLYQRAMIRTLQNAGDEVVAGGSFIHTFQPGGYLLKALYLFYDANDNLVDVATTPGAVTQFVWGTKVFKIDEFVSDNLTRAFRIYEQPAPVGLLVHDFLAMGEMTLAQCPDTATLANVRAVFTGLPANVVKANVVEARLVPVKRG